MSSIAFVRVPVQLTQEQYDTLRAEFSSSAWKQRMEQEGKSPTMGEYIVYLLVTSALSEMR